MNMSQNEKVFFPKPHKLLDCQQNVIYSSHLLYGYIFYIRCSLHGKCSIYSVNLEKPDGNVRTADVALDTSVTKKAKGKKAGVKAANSFLL